MSYLLDDKIKLEQTAQVNAFGRLRTANARLLGEYRYMYGSGTTIEVMDKIVGSGALIKDQDRNCYIARVGTDSGAIAARQTKQYHPYMAGTTNLGMITFVMGQSKVGLSQSVGMFDDLNGFIFRVRDGIAEVVIRKNGVDNEVVQQSNWNGDRLDGSNNRFNKSKVQANWEKAQILMIDYQWLGVGKVRFGFIHGDETIIIHTFYHANQITEVYTNQPSLPIRWEVTNTSTTASSTDLMLICGAVYCEGADFETGFSRGVSTDGVAVPVTSLNATNGKGIIAVRIKNVLEGKPAHPLARLRNFAVNADQDVNYKVVILPGQSAISSAVWNNVPGYGWCNYTTNFTLSPTWNAGEDYQVLFDEFAIGGQANKSGPLSQQTIDQRSASIYQNYDATDSMIMAIIAYRLTADANVRASIGWIEVK